MAKQTITEGGGFFFGSIRKKLNEMFAELYAGGGVAIVGVTATAAELNYNDIAALGTGAASKAVVLNAGEDYTWPATGVLKTGVLKDVADTTLAATFAELNMINGATFTASDLNKLAAVTATQSDINTLTAAVANVTLVATPASGTCAIQFTFKSALGNPTGTPTSGLLYFATTNTGLTRKTFTSAAALTNGSIELIMATKVIHYVTSSGGLLGITLTAAAGDYYPVFVMPNGSLEIGTVCTVNA